VIKRFRKVFKVFWAWQDEAEEIWLREMAQQGWFLTDYTFLVYTFVSGEPADYIYKLDYRASGRRDLDEYLTIFADSGWEHVAEFLNWHYFRSPAETCAVPDIYSDNQSKIEKWRRLLRVMTMLFAVNLTLAVANISNPAAGLIRMIYLCFFSFYGYAFYKIWGKIKHLEQGM